MNVAKYLASINKEKVKSAFTVLLLLGAVGYMFALLFSNAGSLSAAFDKISIWSFLAAILVAIPMYTFKAVYHYYALNRIALTNVSFSVVVAAYLQAQVVRYLPGKIWGLIYQSQKMGNSVSSSQVIMANLFQMVATNFLAFGLVFSIIAVSIFNSLLFYACIPIIIFLVELNHRFAYLERKSILLIKKIIPRINGQLNGECLAIKWSATFLLLIEWVFYFGAFIALLCIGYSLSEIFDIAIWYSAASLLSLIFIFIPAGIVVREAIFVSSASFFSGNEVDMIVIASLLRGVWVVSELCTAFLVGYCFGRGRSE